MILNIYIYIYIYCIYILYILLGIGIDFVESLANTIESIQGCNYYCVRTNDDYITKLNKEFNEITKPIMYELRIDYKQHENILLNVYGLNQLKVGEIDDDMVYNLQTLFATNMDKKGVKNGVILIKLYLYDDINNINFIINYIDNNYNYINQSITINFNDNNKTEYFDGNNIRKMTKIGVKFV